MLKRRTASAGFFSQIWDNKGYLCRSQIFKIIKNPFYHGIMKVQKTGQEFPHIYPRIISKELFDKCQDILIGKKRGSYKYREKEYIFRGLIRCANTGRVVTPDIKKRIHNDSSVSVWNYLRVWDANNPKKSIYIPEEKVLNTVKKVFASIHLGTVDRQEIKFRIRLRSIIM